MDTRPQKHEVGCPNLSLSVWSFYREFESVLLLLVESDNERKMEQKMSLYLLSKNKFLPSTIEPSISGLTLQR